jgi:hypothetical protein
MKRSLLPHGLLVLAALLMVAACRPPLPNKPTVIATTPPPPPTRAAAEFQVSATPTDGPAPPLTPSPTSKATETHTVTAAAIAHTVTAAAIAHTVTSSPTSAPVPAPSVTISLTTTPTPTLVPEMVFQQDDWSAPGSYSAASGVDTLQAGGVRLGFTLPSSAPYGDLNLDGYLDLILVNYFDNSSYEIESYIYWGSADGFSTGRRTGLPTLGARSVSVADLNYDGYLDLLFANLHDDSRDYRVPAWIYWGGADGYSPSRRADLPTQGCGITSIADLDNDGWLDVVVGNHYQDDEHFVEYSWIYWGSAEGFSEGNRTTLDTIGTYANSVADLNQDGWLDIVFSNHRNTEQYYELDSYVYWGGQDGFANGRRTDLPTLGATDNTVSDVNGDGWLDIVFSNNRDNGGRTTVNSYIFWGNPLGFSRGNRLELPTERATANSVADLNGDGYADIVFSNYRHPVSYIYWNSPSGFNPANRTELPTQGAVGNSVDDLNYDGYPDIVFGNLLDDWSNFQIDSYIYWGGPDGYSEADRQDLPTLGGYGSVAVGGTRGAASAAFGTTYARPNPGGMLEPDASIAIPHIYPAQGWLSSVALGGVTHAWTSIEWDVDLPDGTDLALDVAISSDGQIWSDWTPVASGSVNGTNQADLTLPASVFIRYRVTLYSSADHSTTPVLRSVTIRGAQEAAALLFLPRLFKVRPATLPRDLTAS